MEKFPQSNMIQLKSGTADVLRQYGILRLCFFRLFIGQFSSLSLKRQNDVPYAIMAWLLLGYFFTFFEGEIYLRSTNLALTQAISAKLAFYLAWGIGIDFKFLENL